MNAACHVICRARFFKLLSWGFCRFKGAQQRRNEYLRHVQAGLVSVSLSGDAFIVTFDRALTLDDTHQVLHSCFILMLQVPIASVLKSFRPEALAQEALQGTVRVAGFEASIYHLFKSGSHNCL